MQLKNLGFVTFNKLKILDTFAFAVTYIPAILGRRHAALAASQRLPTDEDLLLLVNLTWPDTGHLLSLWEAGRD